MEEQIKINGEQEALLILKQMPLKSRKNLLNIMQSRNSSLAKKLTEESATFEDIFHLSDSEIRNTFNDLNPSIIAIALDEISISYKRKVLSLIDRDLAQQVFQKIQLKEVIPVSTIQKARNKILMHARKYIIQSA